MNTTSVQNRRVLSKRRSSIAVLGLSGLLALAACGADAAPASRAARAPQGDAAGRDLSVSPDQIESRAVSQVKGPTPWWADPARHPANQDPALSNASPWWADPARHPANQDPALSNASPWWVQKR